MLLRDIKKTDPKWVNKYLQGSMLRTKQPHFLAAPSIYWKTESLKQLKGTVDTKNPTSSGHAVTLLKFCYFLYLIYYMGSFFFGLTLYWFFFFFLSCYIISLSFSEFPLGKIILKKMLPRSDETNNVLDHLAPYKK